jgi:hypothetical protein
MVIVTALILIVLLTLGYVLFSPIAIYFAFNFDDGFTSFAGVRLFPFAYKFLREKKRKPARTRRMEIRLKKPGTGQGRKTFRKVVKVFHVSVDELEILQEITINLLKLLRGILKSPDQYYLNISMAGGLGPPDLTGQLYGAVLSVQPILGSSVSLTYRPDYLTENMSGEVVAGAIVRSYKLLSEMIIFAWRLPKIRIMRMYHRLKKGG